MESLCLKAAKESRSQQTFRLQERFSAQLSQFQYCDWLEVTVKNSTTISEAPDTRETEITVLESATVAESQAIRDPKEASLGRPDWRSDATGFYE